MAVTEISLDGDHRECKNKGGDRPPGGLVRKKKLALDWLDMRKEVLRRATG